MTMARPQLSDHAREIAATWCARVAEGPLAPDERIAFQEWIDADTEHPALFERTVAAWQALEDQAGSPEMIMMRGDALETVRRANQRRWTRRFSGWRQVAAIAACLLIVIGGGLAWRLVPTSYETGTGERRVIALADGSRVSLDAATRVDVRYWGDRRQLWLRQGRAKFSVAKDPLRPFSVQAADRMVIATGTQFSVERLSGQVRVVLYEGRVAVLDTARTAAPPQALRIGPRKLAADQALLPGRELVVSTTAPVAKLAQIDAGRSLAWEAGLMQFTDEPLGTVLERMNRYGAIKIRAGDPRAAGTAISGQFVGGDVDAFVEGVTAVFPLSAARQSNGDVVLRSTSRRGLDNNL